MRRFNNRQIYSLRFNIRFVLRGLTIDCEKETYHYQCLFHC